MQSFIQTIEDLKRTVKVNKSEFLFATLSPYLDDAYEKYIVPYIGETLIERLLGNVTGETEHRLHWGICRALGPLSIALATPELGVLIGDSGHTVTRTDKVTVASDQKIARAEESMTYRGWKSLDWLINFLSDNEDYYPEWKDSTYYRNMSKGHYINSAREFQDYGHVDIGYSYLAFEKFRPLLDTLEMKLRRWIGSSLDDILRVELLTPENLLKKDLINCIRVWLAMNVATLHTSQATRVQRATTGQMEFHPVIESLYTDQAELGNFYAEQVTSMEAFISDYIVRYAEELGLPAPVKNDFNSIDKHIFFA